MGELLTETSASARHVLDPLCFVVPFHSHLFQPSDERRWLALCQPIHQPRGYAPSWIEVVNLFKIRTKKKRTEQAVKVNEWLSAATCTKV